MPMFGEGGQRTMAAMRGDRAKDPDVMDMLGTHQRELEDHEDRLRALEAKDEDGEDEAEEAS
jgi:hypothetical protein